MFGLSPVQILIVLAIALVLFGAKRLPEMARGLGRGLREFKGSVSDEPPRSGDEADGRASPSERRRRDSNPRGA